MTPMHRLRCLHAGHFNCDIVVALKSNAATHFLPQHVHSTGNDIHLDPISLMACTRMRIRSILKK